MGLQLELSALQESPYEREQRLRNSLRKRILGLGFTLIVAVLARIIIKDPPPPKLVDYSKDQVRYVPGMLDALPPSERARLDPKVLAKMSEADENALRGTKPEAETMWAKGPYQPAEPAPETTVEAEMYKTQLALAVRKKQFDQAQRITSEAVDLTRPILIRFQRGGYVRAERAERHNDLLEIRLNRSILAGLPNRMIASVTTNGLTWEEPVPEGYVQIQPAKGIKITVAKETARRISVKKSTFDEI